MGGLTVRVKMIAALKDNMRFYAIVILVGVVGIIILLIRGTIGPSEVGNFLLALSNAWGLLLVVLLVSHGSVELPRTMIVEWSTRKALHHVYFKVGVLCDDILELEDSMQQLRSSLLRAVSSVSPDWRASGLCRLGRVRRDPMGNRVRE